MDALAEQLDLKLRQWEPMTAEDIRRRVAEIMEMADQGVLNVSRARVVEQEVMDLLDEPTTRITPGTPRTGGS